jgi:hypothetical protein
MFKKLFCTHDYKKTDRVYTLHKIINWYSYIAHWELKAYKLFKCNKCGSTDSEKVYGIKNIGIKMI